MPAKRLDQLQEAARRFVDAVKARDEAEAKRRASEEERSRLEAEIAALQIEVARAKAENVKAADTHDYDEATTRMSSSIFCSVRLGGTSIGQATIRNILSLACPMRRATACRLCALGDDGKPLGIVEAKRTAKDARVGQQQAKLYADCLEAQFDQRPVIFYSNGYEHWIWDDRRYPPRPIRAF